MLALSLVALPAEIAYLFDVYRLAVDRNAHPRPPSSKIDWYRHSPTALRPITSPGLNASMSTSVLLPTASAAAPDLLHERIGSQSHNWAYRFSKRSSPTCAEAHSTDIRRLLYAVS